MTMKHHEMKIIHIPCRSAEGPPSPAEMKAVLGCEGVHNTTLQHLPRSRRGVTSLANLFDGSDGR